MKVDLIKSGIAKYTKALKNGYQPELVTVLDACQEQFDANWKGDAEDFAAMYDQALSSQVSRRLWTGVDYFPKEAILTFCNEDIDFIRSTFRSLADESKPANGRVSRFGMALDALLDSHRQKANKLPSHYHDDRRVTLYYLTMWNPEKYIVTDYETFNHFIKYVESPHPLHTLDVERVGKVSKIVQVFMSKDEELMSAINVYRSKYKVKSETLSYWKSDFLFWLSKS